MRKDIISRGTAYVTTFGGVVAEKIEEVRKVLLKEGRATFSVCALDENKFYLIGNSTKFVLATELNIPITLVEYDENDFIHISKLDFTAAQFPELVDADGNVRVGDFFDRYMWDGDMYEIATVDLITGEPIYTLTEKEQEMKMFAPFESGVEVHKAYMELRMTEDSDLKVYQDYYIQKK